MQSSPARRARLAAAIDAQLNRTDTGRDVSAEDLAHAIILAGYVHIDDVKVVFEPAVEAAVEAATEAGRQLVTSLNVALVHG